MADKLSIFDTDGDRYELDDGLLEVVYATPRKRELYPDTLKVRIIFNVKIKEVVQDDDEEFVRIIFVWDCKSPLCRVYDSKLPVHHEDTLVTGKVPLDAAPPVTTKRG